jgi:GDP-L-fucose synthase
MSVRDLAETIRGIVGYTGDIVFDASKPDGMPRKLMDVSRAARLGWKAKVGIPDGLRRTYEWYLANAAAQAGVG